MPTTPPMMRPANHCHTVCLTDVQNAGSPSWPTSQLTMSVNGGTSSGRTPVRANSSQSPRRPTVVPTGMSSRAGGRRLRKGAARVAVRPTDAATAFITQALPTTGPGPWAGPS